MLLFHTLHKLYRVYHSLMLATFKKYFKDKKQLLLLQQAKFDLKIV